MSKSSLVIGESSRQECPIVDEILPPGQGLVRVAARRRPFCLDCTTVEIEAGRTLQELVEVAIPDPVLRPWAGVRIGGHEIPRENWHRMRPKPGTLVEVVAGVAGGGGDDGGKNPLATILTIAVIAASIVAPQLLFSAAFLATTPGAIAAGLVSAGIAVAGGLLINAIAPPTRPKLRDLSGAGAGRDSPTYDIAGARNTGRPFGVVPRVLGEHRVVPPYGALPHTEIVGDDEYLRMLFVWGIGPVEVEDRVIGETDVDSFEEVEREFRRGYQPGQLTDQGAWDASSGSYPASAGFGDTYTVSVGGTVDGVSYAAGDTIVFNGLAAESSSAAWDKDGDQPLTLFSNSVDQEDLAVSLTQAAGGQVRTSGTQADELSVDVTFGQGLVTFDNQGNKGSRTVQIKVEYSPAGAGAWSNAPGLSGGVLTVTGKRTSAVRAGHRWTVDQGQYDVRLTRLTSDTNSSQIADACSWSALRSIRSANPIDSEVGLAMEAVRIKATGQLRGIIDQYKGRVTSILPDYDSGSGTWIHKKTRNSAACYRAVLQDAGQARPVADTGVAVADLEDWHGKCQARGYSFDAVIDFASSGRELLQDIASSGGAGCARPGGLWSVTIDEPKPVVQHFSPRDTWGFSATKHFVDLPHALRCRFNNRERNYEQDERIVYRDGFGKANATEFEGFEQFGVTDPGLQWARGRAHLAGAVLRPERYSFFTDPRWLVANRGSVIRVQHDILLVGLGSGRIKDVLDDGGGNCTGFVVDETLEMEAAKSYVLRVEHVLDSGAVQSQLLPIDTETGGVTTVTLTTPVPLAGAPAEDDLFLFGESGLESIEGVVLEIRPRDDLSAQIVFVDAAPEIEEAAEASRDFEVADVDAGGDTISIEDHPFFDGDVGQLSTTGSLPAPLQELADYYVVGRTDDTFQLAATEGASAINLTSAGSGTHTFTRRIPDFSSSITSAISLGVPEVTSVRSDGAVLFREPDGSWTSRILLTLKRRSGLQTDVVSTEARFRPAESDGPWAFVLVERDAGEISLMPVEDGVDYAYQLRWVKSDGTAGDWTAEATHVVVGKSAPPPDVPNLWRQGMEVYWTYPAPPQDLAGYRVRVLAGKTRNWSKGSDWPSSEALITDRHIALPDIGSKFQTVMVKAIDTSGNLSQHAAILTVGLGERSPDNLILSYDLRVARFPGTVIGGALDGAGDLVADDTGELYLPDSDALYLPQHIETYLPLNYVAMTYQFAFTAPQDAVPATLFLSTEIGGDGWRIDYRRRGSDGLYLPPDDEAYLPDGTAPYLGGPSDYAPMPGSLDISRETFDFRISIDAGAREGKISALQVKMDVPDITESFEDLVIAAAGTRLPITKTYRAIDFLGEITLQDDGFDATTIHVVDKNPTLGPLLKAVGGTQATIDVHNLKGH